jgi:hypothetical protein
MVLAVLVGAAVLAALAGCGSIHLSGASAPTEHTYRLTPADVALGASRACWPRWTGDPARDLDAGLAELRRLGVRVVEVPSLPVGATALRRRMLVPRGWTRWSVARRAGLLVHERVHYCRRARLGGWGFERRYLHSAGRWAEEVQAYAAGAAWGAAAGVYTDIAATSRLMRDLYWLHDLEPGQFARETRGILGGAAR